MVGGRRGVGRRPVTLGKGLGREGKGITELSGPSGPVDRAAQHRMWYHLFSVRWAGRSWFDRLTMSGFLYPPLSRNRNLMHHSINKAENV